MVVVYILVFVTEVVLLFRSERRAGRSVELVRAVKVELARKAHELSMARAALVLCTYEQEAPVTRVPVDAVPVVVDFPREYRTRWEEQSGLTDRGH